MEVSSLTHAAIPTRTDSRSPLLRLHSDDRLVALTRNGNDRAFEVLVARYQSRLLAFCRHMLGSREDAEDVLQEVFAAAFHALLADERTINVRPWLYRIARNRSLNHLRRVQPIGVDSMDVHFSDGGQTTADKVNQREDFRQLIEDVHGLPESQRTALLLREIDALSYLQVSEAMETTVPAVKSLLVRARISLAEAAEARQLSCEDVRFELGEAAEGLRRMSRPARRHVKACERCGDFRIQLRQCNRALAAVFPIAPFGSLLMLKKLVLGHLSHAGGGATAAGTAAAGSTAGGALSAGGAALATKTAAGLAAAALVTAGAVGVPGAVLSQHHHSGRLAGSQRDRAARAASAVAAERADPVVEPAIGNAAARKRHDAAVAQHLRAKAPSGPAQPITGKTTPASNPQPATPAPPHDQSGSQTTTLPVAQPPTRGWSGTASPAPVNDAPAAVSPAPASAAPASDGSPAPAAPDASAATPPTDAPTPAQ